MAQQLGMIMTKIYVNATLFTGEAFIEGHGLLVADGLIKDIVNLRRPAPADTEIIDCHGHILAPGFIDLQVNGGDNILFNEQPTAASVLAIAAAHRRFGTTSLLPTCITDQPAITSQALAAVRTARQQDAAVLGIHFEGPHLSADKRGVHNACSIRPLTRTDLDLYRPWPGETMLLTLAPEAVPLEQISALKAQGVIINLGHTNADTTLAQQAFAAGARGVTHLFNAMSGLSAREPGVTGAALDHADCFAGLIADGIHVSDEMLRLAIQAKGQERVFLVSDAMPPAAAAVPQNFQLYGEPIIVTGKQCLNAEGKLAGAAVTLADCVHYAIIKARIPPEHVLRMASTTPAEFIGLGHQLGKLLPGYKADLVGLNQGFTVNKVYSNS
jgi:N-acetylglucosamine-6-phosphate deacetylase